MTINPSSANPSETFALFSDDLRKNNFNNTVEAVLKKKNTLMCPTRTTSRRQTLQTKRQAKAYMWLARYIAVRKWSRVANHRAALDRCSTTVLSERLSVVILSILSFFYPSVHVYVCLCVCLCFCLSDCLSETLSLSTCHWNDLFSICLNSQIILRSKNSTYLGMFFHHQ